MPQQAQGGLNAAARAGSSVSVQPSSLPSLSNYLNSAVPDKL